MPELLQSVYISKHVFNFVVMIAKSLVPFNWLKCWKSDNLNQSLMIMYMKKHMAVVTAKPVDN